MAVLSLPLSGRFLIDDALGLYRRHRTRREPCRGKALRGPDPQPVPVRGAGDLVVKVASDPDEWEQAFRLVAVNYQESGYERPTDKLYRFTQYHALPETTVFVAKRRDRVTATFSLVADNDLLGLPLESLYGDEVDRLRRTGRRLGEITSLAFAEVGQREFVQLFIALIRLMQQYHVHHGGDTWVLTVNPRHSSFYRKVLGVEQLGQCKAYAAVGDAPAEAYWADQDVMRANAPSGHHKIFGEQLPDEALVGPSLPRPLIRYFASQSCQSDEGRVGNVLRSVADDSPRAW